MKAGLVILGDQLFTPSYYEEYKGIPTFMSEDMNLAGRFKYHKHKIGFFFLSMRNHAELLRNEGFKVTYHKLSETPFLENLSAFIVKHGLKKIYMFEIQDKFFEEELQDFCDKKHLELEILSSPMFLCSRNQFQDYLTKHSKPFMKSFYESERKRLGILISDQGLPEGGAWSYDVLNRKKVPKVLQNKKVPKFSRPDGFEEVSKLIEKNFSSHPGAMVDFWLPTNREETLIFLSNFLDYHLEYFGDFQDSITNRDPFLYHAVISPMLNNGLITPQEVVDAVLKKYQESDNISLPAVEGFIRQVIGWREFVRGIYQNYSEEQESKNFFNNQRKLTIDWYQGSTGILPLDDAIKKALKYGYCHHIERLMIVSNLMLLCEIHPREVHTWFMELFVDSADWVMGPNVFGMGQFSDGGIFATKPYISGSNYILKMSDYKKGEWTEIWDGLFWRFIGKHRRFFSRNYRTSVMVKNLDKMDPERKKHLMALAESFLATKTRSV